MRDSEAAAILEAAIRGAATPSDMVERYDADANYISSRIRYLVGVNGWLKKRRTGVYEPTPKGFEDVAEYLPKASLHLILAGRLDYNDLSAVGFRDRLVIRLAGGQVLAFRTEGAREVQEDSLDLGLSLLEQWSDLEAVRADLEDAWPERTDD